MRQVMEAADVSRALRRIAHEVVERNPDPRRLVIVGIHTRGVPLAQRLADHLELLTATPVTVGALDVESHRDDRSLTAGNAPEQQARPATDVPADLSDATVILVDDVLFTGRTIRAALDALIDVSRPRRVQLAVLVDRGHRELPIRADYVGKNLPSSAHERVTVRLDEIDGEEAVYIEQLSLAEGRTS